MDAHSDDRFVGATRVLLYGKPGCHLCEEALDVLWKVQRDEPFDLEIIDIRSDEALYERMIESIPVVEVAGETFSEFYVDETLLRQRLKELRH